MKRISTLVPLAQAEEARAAWLERFPSGFEERAVGDELELAGYVEDVLPHLGEVAVEVEEVEPGWEDRWREFHHGVVVGRLWIGPPWEAPPPQLHAVMIDPGRAFGTGAHATTRLCVELLQERPAGSLLDVGCGSGVLAIAGVKLGYHPVTAVDVDPAAVEATLRNAAANGVAVDTRAVDALREPSPAADTAVANIALAAVQAIVPRLDVRTAVTSGYLAGERLELPGFRHVTRRTEGEWAADSWQRE